MTTPLFVATQHVFDESYLEKINRMVGCFELCVSCRKEIVKTYLRANKLLFAGGSSDRWVMCNIISCSVFKLFKLVLIMHAGLKLAIG